jgi:RNA polymerase sigma-70 factor, ECF subfamily
VISALPRLDARPLAPGPEVIVSVRDMEDARDRELLRTVREGDPEGAAFRELFRRNAAVAKTVAIRVTRSDELAEEAVQEGFLQLWRTPERFDAARATVRRWILTLVHARAVDLVRREQAQRRRAEEAAAEPIVLHDPADDVVAQVARPAEEASVRAALDALPQEQRDVIELMYFGGVSQTGVAEALGLPLGTVKSRTLLAMRKLRNALVETER